MYYTAIDVLAILTLLFENLDVILKREALFKHSTWSAYRRFLYSVLAYYVADAMWGFLDSIKSARLLFIDTSIYFVIMALGITCWTGYIVACLDKTYKLRRTLLYIGRIIAIVVTALVGINIFVPVLFTVDEAGKYHALAGRYLILLAQILTLLFVSGYALYLIVKKRTEEKQKYRTLALFGMIMAAFLIAQVIYPLLPLYAIAYMLGLSLLHTYVFEDEKEIFKAEMEEAKKVSALKQSMTSLLDNMPVMSYSKDIETGKYIACNQAFADYAQKSKPDDVSGLTDAELFDSETAAHFADTDKIALTMNEPYIYYEDVTDISGNPKQFQTTKLKFYDETGKLCLLGMSLDITEMVKAKKENEQTKAAYQEVLNASTMYENIVGMLSEEYFDLYYIDSETDEYIEYGGKTESGHRSIENRGTNFFDKLKTIAPTLVYDEDLDKLLETLNKETLMEQIQEKGVFKCYYRLNVDGYPNFVCLKAARVVGDERHIIIGVTNVDAEMQDRIEIENVKKERKAYNRLSAFSRNLLVLYVVDPETEEYTQYSASSEFEELGIAEKGSSFFDETFTNSLSSVYPDDQSIFNYLFTKKNILGAIELDGIFVMEYRLIISGKPNYVRLKATEVEEDGKTMLVIGLENVDSYVRREKQQEYELSVAREMATKDALTGVSNSHAFTQEKERINKQIAGGNADEFAVVICDINGLKIVNDTLGHQSGDDLIRKACAVICNTFKHSRVFRIGGDEFAVICHGHDYEHIDELLERMDYSNNNVRDVQVAFGVARYDGEQGVEELVESADKQMYDYKAALKENSAVPVRAVPDEPVKYQFPENLKKAYESSPLSFVYYQNINSRAIPVLASEGFCRNVGLPRDSVLDWLSTGMFERMHPDDVGVMSKISDDFLHQRGPYDAIFRCRLAQPKADGAMGREEYVFIHGLGKWQTMPDGKELAVITYSNLSISQKTTVEKLEHYMMFRKDSFYTDPLTDIPNINYLHEFGDEKMQTIRAGGKNPIVIYADVYSMQSYNSQYGIKEGDSLLCLIAKTLVKYFPGALVTRAMADHFVIITEEEDNEALEQRMNKVNRIIRKSAHGNTSGIRAGVYSVEEGSSVSEAFDRAKMALKNIENNMNREVEFFSHVLNQRNLQDRYIIENFSQALKNEYIKTYLHSLHRVETQKTAAFEYLARWVDPERGMLYPSDFIPVLLKYHQLYKLDLYMFEQACKSARYCLDNKLPFIPTTVNFSRQDFDHIDVLAEMNKIYDKYNLDGFVDKSYFIVEITEQDLATAEDAFREQLKKIRDNHYMLWLDDFGSGYSAISTFSQYDFDLIKFDMNLLRHLDDNGGVNRLILEELVHLARKRGIHTLAEGLETEEHMAFVKQIGCELAQGFYYHEPEPVEEMMKRIKSGDVIWQCETPEEREAFNRKWYEQ